MTKQEALEILDWIPTKGDEVDAMEMAIEVLSAQPERKKGKWIKRFDGNEWFWYCTSCKEQWYEDDLYMGGNDFPKYCPNCGCRMIGEDNG